MPPGSSIGPYRLLRRLGAGGMGEVWLAEDTRLHRQVALKMVRPADDRDEAARARLMREARAAAKLNHPHIATVYDVLEDQGEVVIVFEYIEGETLQARIARDPIPAPEAVDFATQIAKALTAAHAHGVVHRDLKPANIIIAAGYHVKVLDFGIARLLAIGTTQSVGSTPQTASLHGFVGTASYAAPEQLVSAAVDERADLYALGVVLFEMISGQRPFLGNDAVQLASSKLGHEAPPLSSTGQLVPPALERLVSALLSRERDRRPPSAADVVSQLRAIFGSPETNVTMVIRQNSALTVAAVSILAIALAGVAAWEGRRYLSPAATIAATSPVVAVMPLANVSGDPGRDFVAAGIAESLISSLAAVPTVTVLSRASVAEARGRTKDQASLTKDLGASYLVEGSVQESGGMLRVSLNLVRPDRSVAWGDSVEGKFESIFELQSRLASALMSALVVRVSATERERMAAQPTMNPDALTAYWQGKALLERFDVKGNAEASIAAFERALQIDSRFALAHAGLGQSYRRKYLETKDPAWAQRAVDEATNALRLQPDSAEVRYLLGLTLAGAGRATEAIEELNRALAIQPNYEDARRQLGLVLAEQGQIDSAVLEFRKAIALRPNAASGYGVMGYALLQASHYKEAAPVLEEMIRLAPDNFTGYQQLGTVYQYLGDNARALENYRKAIAIRPSSPAYSNMGALLHQGGDFNGAVDAYRHAIAIRPNAATTHRNLGDALSRLGRTDEAKRSYLEAIRLFETDLKVNPNDARTMILLAVVCQKAGMPDAARSHVQRALNLLPDSADVLYRAATVDALAGNTSAALEHLQQALAHGYSPAFAKADDDLASLRSNERFKTLLEKKEGK